MSDSHRLDDKRLNRKSSRDHESSIRAPRACSAAKLRRPRPASPARLREQDGAKKSSRDACRRHLRRPAISDRIAGRGGARPGATAPRREAGRQRGLGTRELRSVRGLAHVRRGRAGAGASPECRMSGRDAADARGHEELRIAGRWTETFAFPAEAHAMTDVAIPGARPATSVRPRAVRPSALRCRRS